MALDDRLDLDDRVEVLLGPVAEVIRGGLDRLPPGPPMRVRIGEIAGFSALGEGGLTLSQALEGPDVSHPDEARGPVPPLDRWRRAAGCVLEGAAVRALARQVQQAVPERLDWRWSGAAIHAADRVAPELQLAWPDLALALRTGDPGRYPRAGVAVMRAWEAKEIEPLGRVRYLLGGGVISSEEWLGLAEWISGAEGPIREIPVAVERMSPADIPLRLEPWSWRPLSVPAHPRGGQIRIEGEGIVSDAWAVADQVHRALAASTGGCRLVPEAGGPLGSWEVASAQGFGQVMGARGIHFTFEASGALQIVLADAFVGPLAAVTLADHVGTSGLVQGRWRVSGPHTMSFSGTGSHHLTVHGRRHDRFMMPAKGWGLGEWLEALSEGAWAWERNGDRLVMRGQMMGGAVEVRFRREHADAP